MLLVVDDVHIHPYRYINIFKCTIAFENLNPLLTTIIFSVQQTAVGVVVIATKHYFWITPV